MLAGRNPAKTRAAADGLTAALPEAQVATLTLDLASLESVRAAAEQIRSGYPRLDLLINNAGVMMPPYGQTKDGFELQFGTNHLGHVRAHRAGPAQPAPGARLAGGHYQQQRAQDGPDALR